MSSPTLFELTPVMQEVLEKGGTVKLRPCGASMLPFIREDMDEIVLGRPALPPKKRAIFLYQRANGNLVLHRLIKVCENRLVFRGDNQLRCETNVSEQQLIGQVVCVHRGNHMIRSDSLLFCWYARIAFPLCLLKRLLQKLRRAIRHFTM